MVKKTKPTDVATASSRNVMKVEGDPKRREQLLAGLTAEGLLTNAVLMQSYSSKMAGDIGITEAVQALRVSIAEVNRGDLRSAETVLVGQAAALNAMFAELARRAALNMGEYMDAADKYMRLALKAQSQCRATLETLAVIKNPPVFAKQANIAHGPQQVNNGSFENSTPAPAHAGENGSQQTKLLEDGHDGGTHMDIGAAAAAARGNSAVEALAPVNRTDKPRRKSKG